MSVCKTSLSLTVHLGLEVILLNYINVIVIFRASYFANRATSVWNTLPSDRVDFSSFAAFKRTAEQFTY